MTELDPLWIDWPYARIRRELDTDQDTVTRFVVQLEYNIATVASNHSDPEWRVVARFDHDTTTEGGHDVTDEGLHLDIYRDGARHRRSRSFPTLPPAKRCATPNPTSRRIATSYSPDSSSGTISRPLEPGLTIVHLLPG